MRPALNPFNPGSGLRPPALVGRERELDVVSVMAERVGLGLANRGLVLSGLRGVGKTVLLNEMRSRARASEWLAVNIEARPDEAGATGARQTLAREIAVHARRLAGRPTWSDRVRTALQAITAFSLTIGVTGLDLGVDIARGRADSGDIEVDLPELVEDLCAALAEDGSALALFVDELQDLDLQLVRALLATQHRAGQEGWPFFIFGAGLPHLPRVLSEARSYAERLFTYVDIGRLSDEHAAVALVEPVRPLGVAFESSALELLVQSSGGYPYFLQEYGSAAWEVATAPDLVSLDDARAAVGVGLSRLDAGFFRSRWERATPAERRLLVAMAGDSGSPSTPGDLARRMGLKPTSLGPYRAQLIAKGLVYAPQHGQLAYTVPGMADYVDRHREDLS